jgi:excisionase family DNA binding protein
VTDPVEALTVADAARRLGVSRSTIWRMIAAGELDAEHLQRGRRLLTRVLIPDGAGAGAALPRSRTAQLQEQVVTLSRTVDQLSGLLAQREPERPYASAAPATGEERPRPPAHIPPRARRPADTSTGVPAAFLHPITDDDGPVPAGITARPNPMTHPATLFRPSCVGNRDEALAPERELFKGRRRVWWYRLPLVARD